MFCNNCGKTVENGSAFCTNCGVRLEAAPIAPEVQMTAASEEPVREMPLPPENSGFYEPQTGIAPPPAQAADNTNVKVDFGKGALAFCLVVIGLLAISTGVFAGLYLSVV